MSLGGSILSWDEGAERLFGWSADEAIGTEGTVVVPETLLAEAVEMRPWIARGATMRLVTRRQRRDGSVFDAAVTATPLTDEDGEIRTVSVLVRDVSTQLEAAARVRRSEWRFERLFAASPVGKLLVDAYGRIEQANAAVAARIGCEPAQLVGRMLAELVHPDDRLSLVDAFPAAASEESGTSVGVHRYLTAAGDVLWFRCTVSWLGDDVGRPESRLVVLEDLTEQVASTRDRDRLRVELEHRKLTDDLTGLPNRQAVEEHLSAALDRQSSTGSTLAVLFVGLGRLALVNDSLGHAAGDLLLQKLAWRLGAAVGEGSLVGRFAGDDFVVIAEIDEAGAAVALAERMLAEVTGPTVLDGVRITPTVSVGIAVADGPGWRPEALLFDADAAMAAAAAKGGGWELSVPGLRREAHRRLALEAELREAVQAGSLVLRYQPIIARGGALHGVEALVRWDHPQRGPLGPTEFIPLAEETGLIVPLGAWVLGTACRQMGEWHREGYPDLELSVNVSVRQLGDDGLGAAVVAALEAASLPPGALCLEVTETAAAREDTAEALGRLRDLGVRLAIDDFGVGYSTLLALRTTPADTLKLDRSFVAGVGCNERDEAIVRSVVDLARALELRTVAEGVETEDQAATLRAMGCDLLQGYHWSKPVTAQELSTLLAGWSGPS